METTKQNDGPPDAVSLPSDWHEHYENLQFSRAELVEAIRAAYADLIEFVSHPVFRELYQQMWALEPAARPEFVNRVFVNRAELQRRGLEVPEGVLVQTSAFGDRRPTLFSVKKFLPDRFHSVWENANLTFDNQYSDDEVSRDAAEAWRKPLPVSIQQALIAAGVPLDEWPDVGEGDPVWSQGLGETYVERDAQ